MSWFDDAKYQMIAGLHQIGLPAEETVDPKLDDIAMKMIIGGFIRLQFAEPWFDRVVVSVLSAGRLAADVLQLRSTIRIGITGLARAGKTALLTSLAANLLAMSSGRPALPAVSERLGGRRLQVSVAPAAASSIPRFDVASHVAALAAESASRWPSQDNGGVVCLHS